MSRQIFISRPTLIDAVFEKQAREFERYLRKQGLRPVRLGASNYSLDAPLTSVIDLMQKCCGAIILGYPQLVLSASIRKGGEVSHDIGRRFPTPWNHIEATLAFQKALPVLVVAHEGISGGVFDHGVTGQYVHTQDLAHKNWFLTKAFQGLFRDWKRRLG